MGAAQSKGIKKLEMLRILQNLDRRLQDVEMSTTRQRIGSYEVHDHLRELLDQEPFPPPYAEYSKPEASMNRRPSSGPACEEDGLVPERYRMKNVPRGQCLIINICNYRNVIDRPGSDHDATVLRLIFKDMGFSVQEERDLTADEMKDALAQCSDRCKPSEQGEAADCVVVIILAHGCQDGIIGVDGGIVKLKKIWKPFINNKHLEGKPKVFLIQACRGNVHETNGRLQADAVAFNLPKSPPSHADILIGHATIPERAAFTTKEGSPYAMALAEVFQGYHERFDVISMLILANKKVSEEQDFTQIPCIECTLTKQLVFFDTE